MKNILTIDLEDWYHGNMLEDDTINLIEYESKLIELTEKILFLLDKYENKATFFVLGECAEEFPGLIAEIYKRGHEIASHGYEHKLIYNRSKDYFTKDLKRSIELLENIIGEKVLGFRAPYWSIYKENTWVFDVLENNGIIYDSSLFPFKTHLYGDGSYRRFRHSITNSSNIKIEEIPPSVLKIAGIRIPFCGGFYFRCLPYNFVKYGINRINQIDNNPAVFYLHPYEIDVNKPSASKGLINNFILDFNIKNTEKKFVKLLRDFQFTSIKSYFDFNIEFPYKDKKRIINSV